MHQQQPHQTGVQSQYQGYKPAYQPVGFVQSYYQRPAPGFQNQGVAGFPANTASYQLPNYRGNQPGHDQSLRSDSANPSSAGFSQFQPQNTQGQQDSYFMPHYQGHQPGHDQYLRSDSANPSNIGVSQYQQQNVQPGPSFLPHYRGHQPGHDQSLRSDSTQPSQYGFR